MSFSRNCGWPSRSTLIAAIVLTILTLTLFGDDGPTADDWKEGFHRLSGTVRSQVSSLPAYARFVSKQAVQVSRKVVRVSKTIASFSFKKDASWLYLFFKPSERPFPPSSSYDTDRNGAIEVFEKHGMTVCRIYKVCRLKDGSLEAPDWMSNHSTLLETRCGLSVSNFRPAWTLKTSFGILPYYDWLGPTTPTDALLKFTRNPLSYFFAGRKAEKNLLDNNSTANRVERTCLSPDSKDGRGAPYGICSIKPEGRIANPAFLVNIEDGEPKADTEFQDALVAEFLKVYASEADVFGRNSALLTKPKACFRSIIVAPISANPHATEESGILSSTEKQPVDASDVEWAVASADKVLEDEMKADGKERSSTVLIAGPTPSTESQVRVDSGPVVSDVSESKAPTEINTTVNAIGSETSDNSSQTLETTVDERKEQVEFVEEVAKGIIENDEMRAAETNPFTSEGGIEFFTHRSLDTKAWNGTASPDSLGHLYGVCRIHGACRTPDQAVVLPHWMKKYEDDIQRHCGLSSVTYVNDAYFRTEYNQLRRESDLTGRLPLSMENLANQSNVEMTLDLMGMRVYRSQEQHFMTDFFHDGIHAFDALFNQEPGRHAIFSRKCIYRSVTNNANGSGFGGGCASIPTKTDELNPTVLLQERAEGDGPAATYIRQVLAMMPNDGKKGPKRMFSSQLASTGPLNSTCFRSIVLTRNAYPPPSVLNRKDGNVFFTQNNISRESILHDATPHHHQHNSTCHVRMTILSPREEEQLTTQGTNEKWASRQATREIQNHDAVIEATRRLLRSSSHNISLSLQTFRHDGRTVAEAQRAVQNSEILLSLNNPTMTSIAFARPHTSVIEIQPFGYSAGPYRSFARSLQLRYHALTAHPDEARFRACVEHNFQADWPVGTSADAMQAGRDGLLRLFHAAGGRFGDSGEPLQLEREVRYDGSRREERIPLERVCARAQRMWVDEDEVARIVRADAEQVCEQRAGAAKRPDVSGKGF